MDFEIFCIIIFNKKKKEMERKKGAERRIRTTNRWIRNSFNFQLSHEELDDFRWSNSQLYSRNFRQEFNFVAFIKAIF